MPHRTAPRCIAMQLPARAFLFPVLLTWMMTLLVCSLVDVTVGDAQLPLGYTSVTSSILFLVALPGIVGAWSEARARSAWGAQHARVAAAAGMGPSASVRAMAYAPSM